MEDRDMEREVVVDKYGWKLVKGYNPEKKITFLSICRPEEVDGISVYFCHNTFVNGIMKIDNLHIHIDSCDFIYLSSVRDFIIQQQQVAEFVQEAWIYCLENGFSNI
jgi:hypothetical protein